MEDKTRFKVDGAFFVKRKILYSDLEKKNIAFVCGKNRKQIVTMGELFMFL